MPTMPALLVLLALGSGPDGPAAPKSDAPARATAIEAPVDLGDIESAPGAMARRIERREVDRRSLARSPLVGGAEARGAAIKTFDEGWLAALATLDYDGMTVAERVDYQLLKSRIEAEIRSLKEEADHRAEAAPIAPFGPIIAGIDAPRQQMGRAEGEAIAGALDRLTREVEATRKKVDAGRASKGKDGPDPSRVLALRAARVVAADRAVLREANTFSSGYDPTYSWWTAEPYAAADKALDGYAKYLRETVAGIKPDDRDTIVGNPIGRDAILADLKAAFIPYTPEELVAIARREFAWCDAEMLKASRDLGFGDDWRKSLEHVKTRHVPPGEQPELIRKLADEAIAFVEGRGLVTLPPLAKASYSMEMMTPEKQRVNPFFTGGEVISVSYPTSGMTHEQKMMSMRGNNVHFSRATVHHELIPGHHLQMYMNARFRTYRDPFETPFSIEGWALYWEMTLWDAGFPKTAEDRVGFLFWRMHRCARIIFSLGFHLGTMTPEECVTFLVDRVGHERENATAEVRRSFGGGYGPLYQCAYMLGALQLRALRAELVDSGRWKERAFHDAILREHSIPIEPLRAILRGEPLPRDYAPSWRFAGEVPVDPR